MPVHLSSGSQPDEFEDLQSPVLIPAEVVPSPNATVQEIAESLNGRFERLSPHERLGLTLELFGKQTIVTTGGNIHSGVLLSLLAEVREDPRYSDLVSLIKELPVVLIDTGDLFPESIAYAEHLAETLDLNLQRYHHGLSDQELEHNIALLVQTGISQYEAFDELTKVRPMQRILQELSPQAWIAGNRRDQSKSRTDLPFAEEQNSLIKFFPVADQTKKEIAHYAVDRNIPVHPLAGKYRSVGNQFDTRESRSDDSHEKSGRHGGTKEECGLHLFWAERGTVMVQQNGEWMPSPEFPLRLLPGGNNA